MQCLYRNEINLSEIFVIKVVIPKSPFFMRTQYAEAKFFVPDCRGFSRLWHRVALPARPLAYVAWRAGTYDNRMP
jgi:hypothetical protein